MTHSHVIVEADGGSRGNPGIAGYGAVVRAPSGEILARRRAQLGTTTNNVAEYRGLIAGLTAALGLGASAVSVRMDSKLVVEQMSGRWKVKNAELAKLHAQATELVGRIGSVDFTWMPRAENADADALANEAMDGQPDLTEATAPAAPAADESPAPHRRTGWLAAAGAPTRLLLLRHGQTELSIERRYSGRGNPELTDTGRAQAHLAAARLATERIDAVYTSPLVRARETARVAAAPHGLTPIVHEGLIETDFGAWEGLSFAEAAERNPELHERWRADSGVTPPGGESFAAVAQRVEAARADIVGRHPDGHVLVVSHATPIKSMLRTALDVGPSLLFRLHLDLASLSIADYYPDGQASVHLVNESSYLSRG